MSSQFSDDYLREVLTVDSPAMINLSFGGGGAPVPCLNSFDFDAGIMKKNDVMEYGYLALRSPTSSFGLYVSFSANDIRLIGAQLLVMASKMDGGKVQ